MFPLNIIGGSVTKYVMVALAAVSIAIVSYSFGHSSGVQRGTSQTTKLYADKIEELNKLEAERLNTISAELVKQKDANDKLVVDYTNSIKAIEKDRNNLRASLKLLKDKNDESIAIWLNSPVPKPVIDFLHTDSTKN